jgi:hypothetical protein
MQTWTEVLQNSFADIWSGVFDFLPKLIIALVIFLVGWGVGVLLDKVVSQIIRSLKVDNALRKVRVEEFVQKAGFKLDSGVFVGGLIMKKDKLLKKLAKPLSEYLKKNVEDTPVCVISFVNDTTLEAETFSFQVDEFTKE